MGALSLQHITILECCIFSTFSHSGAGKKHDDATMQRYRIAPWWHGYIAGAPSSSDKADSRHLIGPHPNHVHLPPEMGSV
jgi:hypothetical protein